MKKTHWWWVLSGLIGMTLAIAKYPIMDSKDGFQMRNFMLLVFCLAIAGVLFWKNDAPHDR